MHSLPPSRGVVGDERDVLLSKLPPVTVVDLASGEDGSANVPLFFRLAFFTPLLAFSSVGRAWRVVNCSAVAECERVERRRKDLLISQTRFFKNFYSVEKEAQRFHLASPKLLTQRCVQELGPLKDRNTSCERRDRRCSAQMKCRIRRCRRFPQCAAALRSNATQLVESEAASSHPSQHYWALFTRRPPQCPKRAY